MYPRNAASPPRFAIGAVVQISDGAVQTSGVAVKIIEQGGSEGAGAGTVSYSADGIVYYAPTQAETDQAAFIAIASKAGCIPAAVTIITSASATAGYAGLDWAAITAPTTTVNLSATTIKTATDVETDTADIQARLPAALTAGGNIKADALAISGDTVAADNAESFFDGTGYAGTGNVIPTVTTVTTATNVTTVNGLAAGVITAASIAADAITDAKVASDVTIASVTGAVGSVTGAVGSVTGNVGGNVVGSVGSVTGAVGSVTGAVGSVTGNVGGNVTGSVGSVAAGGITAASIATGAVDADALAADAVAEIADGVWDEARSGHTTAGTYGEANSTIVSGTCITGTLSTTACTTDLTEATDDHYIGRTIVWVTGVLAGQASEITDYDGATKALTYTAVTDAPANGDRFVLV